LVKTARNQASRKASFLAHFARRVFRFSGGNVRQQVTRRLVTRAEVLAMTRVSKDTIRAWIKAGRFPAPVRPGGGKGKKSLWDRAAVEKALVGSWVFRPKAASCAPKSGFARGGR
jgi:predicted DNA-binding transcriptional regulator AlpA